MTEHRLRREDDERLAPGAHGLTAQKVKVLCCVGGLGYNHVVHGSKLEEALHARRGVLGTLAVVPVREKHDDAGEQPPLSFASGNELIDDRLRTVNEVAELRLPEDEGFGIVAGVAVFVA